MTRLAKAAAVLWLASACAGESASLPRTASARNPEAPLYCVRYWAEARYRNYGYDHIVHLGNGCAKVAICDVATNVNPTPIRVRLQPDELREVLTFRGSPAQEFVPHVSCWLEK